ncbi:MAG: hypothetical protein ACI4SP_02180, partial [Eubacteriales bacterium]
MSVMDKLADKWHVDRRHTKIPLLRKSTLTERKARTGWLFVLPFALGMLLIYLPIIIDSFCFSFLYVQRLDGIRTTEFYGIASYQKAMTQEFWKTLLQGFEQLLINVPTILIFSLFIAVILNQKMVGRAAFRAIFFIPVILATGLMDSINAQDALSGGAGIDDGSGDGGGGLISL